MDQEERKQLRTELAQVNQKIEALLEGAAGEDLNSTQKELLSDYKDSKKFLQQQLTNTAQGALYVSPPLTLSILPYHS
jgi:hypothetical protein